MDPRALQKPGAKDRVAACWYTPTLSAGSVYTMDVNLTDQNTHTVALYMLNWDNTSQRAQTVQVLDAGSGAVLDSRTVSSFSGGQYLVWNLTGHVVIQVTNNVAGSNAVVNGLFFSAGQ